MEDIQGKLYIKVLFTGGAVISFISILNRAGFLISSVLFLRQMGPHKVNGRGKVLSLTKAQPIYMCSASEEDRQQKGGHRNG